MLKIYNTLTKKKEIFRPINDRKVSFYHCGPTVYWVQHIGNMRAMVLADLIRRSLEYLRYKVKFVRNYTDVGHLTSDEDEGEDKMEKGAKREKKTPQEIAEKYIKIFEDDIHALNVLDPQIKPKATDHIKEIIDMIRTLQDKGFAYTTDLAVYFDVSRAKNYTRLSGQILEKNIKEAGKGEVSDPNKKHPADFALWFFKAGKHKKALQFWESPFKSPLVQDGEGFPGWAIECSAMSKKYLGNTIDIHMGGVEHIPVHHTNEIAQSESANGVKFVNYWLHNEHLNVNGGKMSKSEGTAWSLAEIKKKGYDPLVLRYFFLNSHYRSKQNFTWESLDAAETALNRIKDKVLEMKKLIKKENLVSPFLKGEQGWIKGKIDKTLPPPFARMGDSPNLAEAAGANYKKKFIATIEDDFNLPRALALAWKLLKAGDVDNYRKLELMFDFDKILGLDLRRIKTEALKIPKEISGLVKEREQARDEKKWAKADELREEIEKAGFIIKDTPSGQIIIDLRILG